MLARGRGGDGHAVGADHAAADGAERDGVAAVDAAGLFLVAVRRGVVGLAEEAAEGALVERAAHGDADADEGDGHFGGGPDD